MRTAERRSIGNGKAWERLQRLLFKLEPGRTVTVSEIAARTGLAADSVDIVLQALTRAALFRRTGPTTFVRARLTPGWRAFVPADNPSPATSRGRE